jgi:hypothetical protein
MGMLYLYLNKPTVSKYQADAHAVSSSLLRFPATSNHSPQRSETMLFIAVILRTYDLLNLSLYDKFSDSDTICHILCKNCILKCSIKGKTERKRKRGGRRKQLMDDFKENRIYWNFKAEALDRTPWCAGFRREQIDLQHILCKE